MKAKERLLDLQTKYRYENKHENGNKFEIEKNIHMKNKNRTLLRVRKTSKRTVNDELTLREYKRRLDALEKLHYAGSKAVMSISRKEKGINVSFLENKTEWLNKTRTLFIKLEQSMTGNMKTTSSQLILKIKKVLIECFNLPSDFFLNAINELNRNEASRTISNFIKRRSFVVLNDLNATTSTSVKHQEKIYLPVFKRTQTNRFSLKICFCRWNACRLIKVRKLLNLVNIIFFTLKNKFKCKQSIDIDYKSPATQETESYQALLNAFSRRKLRLLKTNAFTKWKHEILFMNISETLNRIDLLKLLKEQHKEFLNLKNVNDALKQTTLDQQKKISLCEEKEAKSIKDKADLTETLITAELGLKRTEFQLGLQRSKIKAISKVHLQTTVKVEAKFKEIMVKLKDNETMNFENCLTYFCDGKRTNEILTTQKSTQTKSAKSQNSNEGVKQTLEWSKCVSLKKYDEFNLSLEKRWRQSFLQKLKKEQEMRQNY